MAENQKETKRKDCAKSVANRPLPPPPEDVPADGVSLVLFYQYVEPMWTPAEHKKALSFVINHGKEHKITGRGRCAAEGLNCTLTGTPGNLRAFCEGLRKWNPLFLETDFKFTDGLNPHERFKALTIRKTEELVAYGLNGDDAVRPSLESNTAKHVEAHKFHKMMEKPDTVIIDVRNRYENEIGHFQPPEGGAKLLDPNMRNSHEFPKWLNAPETQKELSGKTVMMYCTGGIRCERASALLSQMKEANEDFNPNDVVMVRGGIERYMKTFPEGGYWKGKNYLFDRRFQQVPELKSKEALEADIESQCVVCKGPCDEYRGQHKCSHAECKVPVLVCQPCQPKAKDQPDTLQCPLCEKGFELRSLARPELNSKAKKAETPARGQKRPAQPDATPSKRLHVGKLPLVVDADQIKDALGKVETIEWLLDTKTKLFYGSAFVGMKSVDAATAAVQKAEEGLSIGGRKVRVAFSEPKPGQPWPPAEHKELPRPPLPV
jgi:predicted sulfurtransferase